MSHQKPEIIAAKSEFLKTLGFFTLTHSALVRGIQCLIWELLDLDGIRGEIVTCQLGGAALLDMLKSLVNLAETEPEAQKVANKFLKKLDAFNLERVDIAHSYWRFDTNKSGELVLRSQRFTARGKLKENMETWTIDELKALMKEITDANEAVVGIIDGLKKIKVQNKEENNFKV